MHSWFGCQIRNRARHAEHAVARASTEREPLDGGIEKGAPAGVGPGDEP
jgi:hypothetical protein